MRFEIPGFYEGNPKNEEEKLICELVKCLRETTSVFVRLNANKIDGELFFVLCDSAFAYVSSIMKFLCDSLIDKNKVPEFLDECRKLFESYMKRLLEGKKE
jgi:hypothetical protein